MWKAIEKKTRETVALKKIFDAFQNATDAQARGTHPVWLPAAAPCRDAGPRQHAAHEAGAAARCLGGAPGYAGGPRRGCWRVPRRVPGAQRTFREIMFLQELNNHENIIRR